MFFLVSFIMSLKQKPISHLFSLVTAQAVELWLETFFPLWQLLPFLPCCFSFSSHRCLYNNNFYWTVQESIKAMQKKKPQVAIQSTTSLKMGSIPYLQCWRLYSPKPLLHHCALQRSITWCSWGTNHMKQSSFFPMDMCIPVLLFVSTSLHQAAEIQWCRTLVEILEGGD